MGHSPNHINLYASGEEVAALNFLLSAPVTSSTGAIHITHADLAFNELEGSSAISIALAYYTLSTSIKPFDFSVAYWQANYRLDSTPHSTPYIVSSVSPAPVAPLTIASSAIVDLLHSAWTDNAFSVGRLLLRLAAVDTSQCSGNSCRLDMRDPDPSLSFIYYEPPSPPSPPPPFPPPPPCAPPASLDSCGVCSGPGTGHVADSDRDVCGICFGDNAALDDCGVCFGGDAAKDGCGMCYGNNASCAGCDGIPYSGTTPDICGVCGGDGLACSGCNFIPIPLGGVWFDGCGVCGGPSGISACATSCLANGTAVYDCFGVCNGTAYIDDCGMCVEGSTPNMPNAFKDSCGDCFGGDRARDVCGECHGNNARRDACGICDGGDVHVDSCGVCFGSNRDSDLCGVCGGNGTSCVGCDSVANSNKVFDACGVCGGSDDCAAHASSNGTPMLFLILAGLGSLLLLASLVLGLDAALAAAPAGTVVILITDVGSSTRLWEDLHDVMEGVMLIHDAIIRPLLDDAGGYIVRTEGDSFVVAFAAVDASRALRAAVAIQDRLTRADWPKALLKHPACPTQAAPPSPDSLESNAHVWRGLRVRIGIHACAPRRAFDDRTHRIAYTGACMAHADTITCAASAGQIVVSHAAIALLPTRVLRGIVFTPFGAVSVADDSAVFDICNVSSPSSCVISQTRTPSVSSASSSSSSASHSPRNRFVPTPEELSSMRDLSLSAALSCSNIHSHSSFSDADDADVTLAPAASLASLGPPVPRRHRRRSQRAKSVTDHNESPSAAAGLPDSNSDLSAADLVKMLPPGRVSPPKPGAKPDPPRRKRAITLGDSYPARPRLACHLGYSTEALTSILCSVSSSDSPDLSGDDRSPPRAAVRRSSRIMHALKAASGSSTPGPLPSGQSTSSRNLKARARRRLRVRRVLKHSASTMLHPLDIIVERDDSDSGCSPAVATRHSPGRRIRTLKRFRSEDITPRRMPAQQRSRRVRRLESTLNTSHSDSLTQVSLSPTSPTVPER
ncbi:uncharacterized protein AMSG_10270 [Thecamonas trahens ATCC 50062]|uniref:Guanylate cyclase domain-containing protein n=1 Tax=Thecamonas trahens ATCC 50062 TaxID=461836 RepID=A0A0L0DQI4_THETB|nr:hypothetical protein AMSG_10270 [Thecamonas trahens ATCC 50062]KNC54291.1 hypothetical protein AMSG_10270 [Thecamonas trahens ATCC 50062]|eukprot:XP_013753756.1 hypothetical protein AMSG_10270 [Thecamonas trahens ATCC 50062]